MEDKIVMIRLSVVGGRNFNDIKLLTETLNYMKPHISCLVSGGCRGADALAERWAVSNGIRTEIFRPEWDTYGKRAGFMRNETIVSNCDSLIAFWDGQSKGTKHSIDLAERLGKRYMIIKY